MSLALTALLAALPGYAEESGYETVITARPLEERRPTDDPSAFTTLLRVREAPPGADLPLLLTGVAGLRVRSSGPGGRATLALRGTDGHQALVILDGIRLSDPGSGGADLSLFDPAHLAEAEVHRGGSSARWGSDAVGGALLLRTPALRSRSRARALVGYGSDSSVTAQVSQAGGYQTLRYLASGSYRRGAGDFRYLDHNGLPALRENNDSQLGEVLLKADLLPSSRWQLALLENLAVGERGAPGMIYAPCTTARQRDLRQLAAVQLRRRQLSAAGGQLQLSLSHRLGRFEYDDVCAHNQASHTQSHTLSFGGDLELPQGQLGQLLAGVELRQHLLQDLLGYLSDALLTRLDADLWLAQSLTLWRGRLVLSPAVRLAATSDQGLAVVPSAGAILYPLATAQAPWLQPLGLAANIGRSFRHPSFLELYINLDSLRGNPELRPEDALEGDVGLRWAWRGWTAEAVAFARRMKNVILFTPISPFQVEAQNHAASSALGAEAALTAPLPWGLDLGATYSYTRTRFGEPALLELPGHPRHRATARLAWRYPFKAEREPTWQLRLWTRLTAESSMYLDRFNSPTFLEEGRLLLSAGGAWRYRRLTLSARGQNLLDKRDAVDTLGFPLAPASFFLALSAEL